jgi:hypothetical protein
VKQGSSASCSATRGGGGYQDLAMSHVGVEEILFAAKLYFLGLFVGLAAVLERSLRARQRAGGAYLRTAARSGGAAFLLCQIWTKIERRRGVLLVEFESNVREA